MSEQLLAIFHQMLHQESYRIELDNDSKMRITGVQEGELFLAVRCKVFQVSKPVPTPKEPEPPSGEPEKKP